MSEIRLVADGGGTSVNWALVDGQDIIELEPTAGINPVVMSCDEINTVVESLRVVDDIVPTEIYYYGAGCRDEATCGRVRDALQRRFPESDIFVDSDLAGAAMALFGDRPGIACILGTGSNAGVWNGREIVAKPASLGFILGDEGSGASIGKRFIHDYYSGKLSEEAMALIAGSDRGRELADLATVIDKVYRKPAPNSYLASFTRLIGDNINVEEFREIVEAEFREFDLVMLSRCRELAAKSIEDGASLPVGFVGSVAACFERSLEKVVAPALILRNPLLHLAARFAR